MSVDSRVVVANTEGKILLGRRASGVETGKWSLLGGKPNKSENLHDAAQRELFEETGLAVGRLHFLFESEFGNWIGHYFLAIITSPLNLTPDVEHDELRWFGKGEIEKIKDQLAFDHYLILQRYFTK